MQKNIFILLALSIFTGCASYKEKPISLQEDTIAWEKISQEFAGTLRFEDALKTGLILNMELNKMRAKYALSEDVEKESGWWKDPSISLGITRHYTPTWQTNLSPEISFTIPITGLPGLEKEVAKNYREADYWMLAQKEIDFREQLEKDFTALAATQLKIKVAEVRLAELKDEVGKMEVLSRTGESSPAKLQIVSSRLSSTEADFQALRAQEHTQKLEFVKRIGLHPAMVDSIALEFTEKTATEIPPTVPAPSPESLLALPRVREQLANYAASETELKTEIRKQYPELKLSPGFERDGDDDITKMFSLGIGLDLPLWNRNRRAIAEAGGNREIKRIETIQTWREQIFTIRGLEKRQTIAREHCIAEAKRLATRIKNARQQKLSLELGEADFADISEARQEAYSVYFTFIDSLQELREIQSQIRALTPKNNK